MSLIWPKRVPWRSGELWIFYYWHGIMLIGSSFYACWRSKRTFLIGHWYSEEITTKIFRSLKINKTPKSVMASGILITELRWRIMHDSPVQWKQVSVCLYCRWRINYLHQLCQGGYGFDVVCMSVCLLEEWLIKWSQI